MYMDRLRLALNSMYSKITYSKDLLNTYSGSVLIIITKLHNEVNSTLA
jgi:hypothetical protein